MPPHRDIYNFKRQWLEHLKAFKRTWFCKKCGRYCPNCAGRSCVRCCIYRIEVGHFVAGRDLRPVPFGVTHQDSMFTNTYQAKSYYTVHPEWNSEVVNDPSPKPLHRPPWPWEQPRYRVNMQLPTTYESPAQQQDVEKADRPSDVFGSSALFHKEGGDTNDRFGTSNIFHIPDRKKEEKEEDEEYKYAREVPPLSYHLTQAYRTTHPQHIVHY